MRRRAQRLQHVMCENILQDTAAGKLIQQQGWKNRFFSVFVF